MNKNLIKGIFSLFLVLVSLFAFLPISGINKNKPDLWMQRLDDDRAVTSLSIPGTHDSGATHSIFDVAGKCQDISISEQLAIGVRFFDLRLKMTDNKFVIVHSFVDQRLTFESVLKDMAGFISSNSSEFLIISIKQEADSVNSTLDFEELLLEYFKEYEELINLSTALPETVGEARGKIHILSRFSSTIGVSAYYGWIDDDSFLMDDIYVQDNYCVSGSDDKISSINDAFDYALNNEDKLVLNFTSCYYDSGFPPTYAGTAGRDINPWLLERLQGGSGKVGIIVADFITAELSKAIYGRNF
jgi:1-phosphatidylinositol phosphodiesterase